MPKFFEEYKNKKIALCFFGISYKENYDHWMNDWFISVDWRQNNYRETLFHLLNESNHSVDVFFSTYNSPLNQELVMDLNPKNMVFNDFITHPSDEDVKKYQTTLQTHAFIQRNRRFKEVINLVPKDEYDFIIMTRFDLHLLEQLAIINVDTQSLNVSRWCEGGNCTEICDNFYIIPKGAVEDFVNFIESIPDDYSYHYLHKLEGCPDINYMFDISNRISSYSNMIDGEHWSHNCPVYRIRRKRKPIQQNNNTPSPPTPMTPEIKQVTPDIKQVTPEIKQAIISNHGTLQTHKKRTQFRPLLNTGRIQKRTRRKIR